MNPLKTLVFLAVLCSFASVGFAADCSLAADYTQTADDSSCDNLYTNGYTWDTAGFDLTVAGLVDVNVAGGLVQGRTETHNFGALKIRSGCEYNATSGLTKITSEHAGEAVHIYSGGTFTHNQGIIDIATGANTGILFGDQPVYNLIGTVGGNSKQLSSDTTIEGDWNISTGNWFTNTGGRIINVLGTVFMSGGTFGITIAQFGDMTVGGLRLTGGTYNATSGTTTLTGGGGVYAIYKPGGGTFKHSKGTVKYLNTGGKDLYCSDPLYNLIIEDNGGVSTITANLIDGNLTINSGTFARHTNYKDVDMNVTGEVLLNGGTLGATSDTGTNKFGSMILNGGTFRATNGTTYFTQRNAGDDLILKTSGTFTHNDGTVYLDVDDAYRNDFDARVTFYNLIIKSVGTNKNVQATVSPLVVENDLTVVNGTVYTYPNTARNITVGGDATIKDNGTINMGNGLTQVKDAGFGNLTIEAGGTYTAPVLGGTTVIAGNLDISGIFTHNDGTVNMTGADVEIQLKPGLTDFYNLVAPYSGILTISGGSPRFYGNLTLGDASSTFETGTNSIYFFGSSDLIDNGATLIDAYITYWWSTNKVPANDYYYLIIGSSVRTAGDIRTLQYFRVYRDTIVTLGGDVNASYGPEIKRFRFYENSGLITNGYDITLDYFDALGSNNVNLIINDGSKITFRDNVYAGFANFDGAGTYLNVNGTAINGTGIVFDGIDDYVTAEASSSDFSGDLTAAAWVKFHESDMGTFSGIIGTCYHKDFYLQKYSNDRLYMYHGNLTGQYEGLTVPSGRTMLADTWYHVAMVRNTSESKWYIYQDGLLENSDTYSLTPATAGYDIEIGGLDACINQKLDGVVDEVYLYDKALSLAEINDIKDRNAPPGYIAYWNFNERNGSVAEDATGTYDGTLMDGANFTTIYFESESISPTNLWTINASEFTSASPWYTAFVSNGNSVGPGYIYVLGEDVTGNIGYWDFTGELPGNAVGIAVISAPGFGMMMVVTVFILAGCLLLLRRK